MKWMLSGRVISLVVTLTTHSLVMAQTLPTATSNLFSGSGNCATCHRAGNGAFLTAANEDISPATLWPVSMMAHAARDPLWQAKVSAEVAAHPALQQVIEDKCTTCHMPQGKTAAIHAGAAHFTFAAGLTDPLSLDGVSCTLCHQIQPDNPGSSGSFSGGYLITAAHDLFGPYDAPTTMPMFNQTGYMPRYAAHVHSSTLCATCHTLYTPYVDNNGQVAGYFPEQTPYLEWLNSSYPAEGKECQSCHMTASPEAMKIAAAPPWLATRRSPIWRHDFTGANLFMQRLISTNAAEIGSPGSEPGLVASMERTRQFLQESIALAAESFMGAESLFVRVKAVNLAGHKFPTGFPSRRAWLHLRVTDGLGKVIFESGDWDAQGEIPGLDAECEPHHTRITRPDQVQIYEGVMQDVDGKVTHTLLRGAQYRKDNRLPPRGFLQAAPGYDDIAIVGEAEADPDFNLDVAGIEGSGSDCILYGIPVADKGPRFTVSIELVYQTVSPRFAVDLFASSTGESVPMQKYYEAAGNSPVSLRKLTLDVTNTGTDSEVSEPPESFGLLHNYPNPFNASTTIIWNHSLTGLMSLQIVNLRGEAVRTLRAGYHAAGEYRQVWDGLDDRGTPLPSGLYIAVLTAAQRRSTLRVALLK